MQNNKKRTGWIALISVLTAILLVVVVAIAYYNSKLNLIHYDDGSREIDTSTSYPVDNDELDIGDLPDAPEGEDGTIEILDGDIYSDRNVTNILLLGTDERTDEFSDNARADSIMVLSLNTKDHTMKLVSIERGIGVPIPGRNDDWLTHTFRYGGAALTMQTVRDCFKLDIDRYVRVNFYAFEKAIDTIGGIDIEITQEEADGLNGKVRTNATAEQEVVAGINHLNGHDALAYSRIRYIDSDWKRIERQRKVIQAAIDQVKNADIATLNALADEILPMVQTNLTKAEITSLLLEMPSFISAGAQMEQMTIPTYETCWNSVGVDGRKMIGVDFEANAKILREFFYGENYAEEQTNGS
ncbi:LCP family protein [uncultured Ruthenibacterium sp.]|uniref:LCP family protein n=1 Tax=uncultured Ruthenibacterium sp. TaxID=1905347 RepID=UPI00349EC27A